MTTEQMGLPLGVGQDALPWQSFGGESSPRKSSTVSRIYIGYGAEVHKLVKCACVAIKCSGRCSCKAKNLPCTELCKCEAAEGSCYNLPTDEINSEDDATSDSKYNWARISLWVLFWWGVGLGYFVSNQHGFMLHLLRIYKPINLFNWNQPLSVFD